MKKYYVLLFLSFLFVKYSSSQSVTISQPNGGEILYACQQYPVTWSQTGSPSNYWNIDYSLDGGIIWASVTSNYLSTNGQFLWTVPNVQSNTVLMRISDANDPSVNDQSNAVFTINIPVNLTSPNGGEIWQGNTVQNITWNGIGTSNTYTIQYSINSGSTWTNIVTNYNTSTGTYAWTVPTMATSTNCLVRVMDYVQNCMQDVSDAVFTIIPSQPILLSPNGLEQLKPNCTFEITWEAATFYSNLRLDYSTDNGVTWNLIASNASNYGYYYWAVPNIPSTECLIRASNSADLSVNDLSDAVFTILPSVTVNSPNGGETLIGCSNHVIQWTKSDNCLGNYNLKYSTDNGLTYTVIDSYVTTNYSAVQTYNWTVPNGITSSQCLIMVESYSFPSTMYDVSDAVFNIIPSNDITVTSANGGESWQGLSTQTITWTNLPSASGQYTIQYSTNGGSSWSSIASNITGNSYNWQVPNNPGTTYKIKVLDYINNCKFDVSDANFTVTPAQPILLSPNGGEIWYSGTSQTIEWDAATFYSNVRLDYSTDNGVTWNLIASSASNYGYYYWTVPNLSSENCLIKASNTANIGVNDVSNSVFTIKPAVTILTPNGDNGNTIWGGCTVTSITIDRSPAWNNYKVEYTTNNGATWELINSNWTTNANPATYNWNMPNASTGLALVRVTPTSATSYFDMSDSVFSIKKPVTIIQPNFGGIMEVGTSYDIMWESDGISNIYDIFYSANGGSTWTTIVLGYNTSTNTYPWTIPNTPSGNSLIRVRDNINNCKEDTSDMFFTISTLPADITLLTPNGNDTISGCEDYLISWSEISPIGTYDLDYSLNNGISWTNITSNYTTTNLSYNWVVPNISTENLLVRVKATANSSIYDWSDALVTIGQKRLNITQADTTLCSNIPLQLNVTGGNVYSWSPAIDISCTDCPNPIVSAGETRDYVVASDNGICILYDTIHIEVAGNSSIIASVTINSSVSGDSICAGEAVTFTATPNNEGSSPIYQWKVNGTNVGTNSNTFTSFNLTDLNLVSVEMISNLPCVTGSPATSNVITMHVTSPITPLVSFSSVPGNTVCAGTAIDFNANPINGGSNPIYQWKVNGNNVGTNSPTFNLSNPINGDQVQVVMTSNASCLAISTANSISQNITVNAIPAQATLISGETLICPSSTNTYSIGTVSGATSYTWTLPLGWSGISTTNSIIVTSGLSDGQISVIANNVCGSSPAQTLNVTINSIPNQPSSISGMDTVCYGSSQTYSIAAVPGAISYLWTLPSGWIGSSTTNTITVVAGLSGTINVRANNDCGSSLDQSFDVFVKPLPSQAIVIIGSNEVCFGSNQTYSIDAVSGATSYTWSLPSGWSGTSTTNSINTTIGQFGGIISVIATNSCGNSNAQTLSVAVNTIPSQVIAISGSNSVCEGTEEIYSVDNVAGVTSYTWTFPSTWTGTSTTNSIALTPGNLAGDITVIANNSCGSSIAQSLNVATNSIPQLSNSIDGSTLMCANSSQQYSVDLLANATSYTWVLPNGWIGNSTTNSITTTAMTSGTISVTANNNCGSSVAQTIDVVVTTVPDQPSIISGTANTCLGSDYTYSVTNDLLASSYTWILPSGWVETSITNSITATAVNSGIISVFANNTCGSSLAQNLNVTVNEIPTQPDVISGPITVCEATSQTYSVPSVSGATSYEWTLPSGWSGTSSTNSINVTTGITGQITVRATNSCGSSAIRSLSVDVLSVPSQPAIISGSTSVCSGTSEVYSIPVVPGAISYTWTLPSGWGGSSTINSINTTVGNSGNITVRANNSCGSSTIRTLTVSVTSMPNVTVTADLNTLNVAPTTGASYQWLDCNNSFLPINGATSQTFTATSNGNYAVRVNKNGCADTSVCSVISTINIESLAQNKFKIYPNPNDGNFVVDFGEFISNAGITIFDGKGSIVYEMGQINETINPIQLNVPVGIYYVKVETIERISFVKLVIK